MNQCPDCKKENTFQSGAHELIIDVGTRRVCSTWLTFERCSNCGYYELPVQDLMRLEQRAALTVLRECGDAIKPQEIRYARKCLGLRQIDAAEALDMDHATISRIENAKTPITSQYRLSLCGLLEAAIVRGAGGDPTMRIECAPLSRTGT